GTVWCWGNNDYGQLGDGTNVSRSAPDLVPGLSPVVSLGANWRGVCAAESDGTIWCWGLGPPGYAINLPTRITVPEIRGTQVVVSGTGDGYLIADGVLKAWYGQQLLDLFTLAHHVVVVEVSGDGQSCIRSSTSEVYCSWILV